MADSMSGLRKAAVLLVQMGKEHAAKVLGQMRDSEVEELTAEIVRTGYVDADAIDNVVDEFHSMMLVQRHVAQGGMDFARAMLIESMGKDKAGEIVDRLAAVF